MIKTRNVLKLGKMNKTKKLEAEREF